MSKTQPRLFDEETEVIEAEVYPKNASIKKNHLVEFVPSEVNVKTSTGLVITGVDDNKKTESITDVFSKMVSIEGAQAAIKEHGGYSARAIIELGYFEDTNSGSYTRNEKVEHVWKPTSKMEEFCRYRPGGSHTWSIYTESVDTIRGLFQKDFIRKISSIIERDSLFEIQKNVLNMVDNHIMKKGVIPTETEVAAMSKKARKDYLSMNKKK